MYRSREWGSSSVGRASRSQRGGREFESLLLHHSARKRQSGFHPMLMRMRRVFCCLKQSRMDEARLRPFTRSLPSPSRSLHNRPQNEPSAHCGIVSQSGFQAALRKTGQPKSPDGAGDCKTCLKPAPKSQRVWFASRYQLMMRKCTGSALFGRNLDAFCFSERRNLRKRLRTRI